MTDFSNHMRLAAMQEMADDIASLAVSLREALYRENLVLADLHFEQIALIGREIRRTRAEMIGNKGGVDAGQ